MRTLTISAALNEALREEMTRDDSVIVIGEDISAYGGTFDVTKGLIDDFGRDRVFGTAISEAAIVGAGVGSALAGMRPVVEIMFPDFALVAADQLFNQIAKARHMYGGKTDLPLVARTRIATGCGYGGQHSMDPVALTGVRCYRNLRGGFHVSGGSGKPAKKCRQNRAQ